MRSAGPVLRRSLSGALALALGAGVAAAQRPEGQLRTEGTRQEPAARTRDLDLPGTDEELAELRAAVHAGLVYLTKHQNADGSFAIEKSLPATPLREAVTVERAPVAVTALGALAFLAYGADPRDGEFAEPLRRSLDYLLSRCQGVGAEHPGYIFDLDDARSRMHGHGFATLALAEAAGQYARTDEERARLQAVVNSAVRRLVLSQSTTGGWWYDPVATPAHENSITICAVQALRAARDAGFGVPSENVERALDYVIRCRKKDGSYQYAWNDDKSSVSLTAASVATLIALGKYDGDELEQALEWIDAQPGLPGFAQRAQRPTFFPHYERLYVALAYYRAPERTRWKRWFPQAMQRLLAGQEDRGALSGSWPRGDESPSLYGRSYETAVNCLLLSIPFGYLPSFQR